jgi:hypothetical protein
VSCGTTKTGKAILTCHEASVRSKYSELSLRPTDMMAIRSQMPGAL